MALRRLCAAPGAHDLLHRYVAKLLTFLIVHGSEGRQDADEIDRVA